jgi:hypothetical protein
MASGMVRQVGSNEGEGTVGQRGEVTAITGRTAGRRAAIRRQRGSYLA